MQKHIREAIERAEANGRYFEAPYEVWSDHLGNPRVTRRSQTPAKVRPFYATDLEPDREPYLSFWRKRRGVN